MSLTAALFMLGFVGALGMGLFRNPIYGLYAYIATFYLDAPNRWWGADLPDLRWSLIAAVVTAVGVMRVKPDPARTPWYRTGPALILMAYTLWLWIQTPWALNAELHRECCIHYTKFVITYFLIYRLVDTPERARDFMLVHVIGSFYLGYLAFGIDVSGRLDGIGGAGIDDSNTLGMHAATAAVTAAMLIFALNDWRRIVAVVAIPFILNVVVLTGSRGAFLALVAGGLILFLLRPREKPKLFYALAVMGLLGFGYVASETFWERMGTIESAARQDENIDNSAEGRIEQVKAGFVMFNDYPLGVGHRGFAVLSPQYLDVSYLDESGARSSHNTFITTLVEQGFPGAILFSLLLLWIARACIVGRRWARARRPLLEVSLMTAACGGLVVAVIGGMFADFLKAEVVIWLLALVAGLETSDKVRSLARRAQMVRGKQAQFENDGSRARV